MVHIEIDNTKCFLSHGKECKNCIVICPMNVLGIRQGRIKGLRPQECITCHCCKGSCPAGLDTIKVDESTPVGAKEFEEPTPLWEGLRMPLGRLNLQSPLILGSGPIGRNSRGWLRAATAGCGAMVSKTTTPLPWLGNPAVRIMKYGKESIMSCEGLPNIGVINTAGEVKHAKTINPKAMFVPSISGSTESEYIEMAQILSNAGADALELAIKGCLNFDGNNAMAEGYWNLDPRKAFQLINTVRKAVNIPLWIKGKGNDGYDLISAYEDAGADAVIIRLPNIHALPIDPVTGHPNLVNISNNAAYPNPTYHGPFAKSPGVKIVADISRRVKIPIIGNGGITCGQDVIDYIRAGASAVQLQTIIICKGISVIPRILSEIETSIKSLGHKSLESIKGDLFQYLGK
jgi:dihydroorotate dehydrogenase (NAD+) catalytic subunit